MKKYIFTVIYILAITSGFAQVYNVENDDIYTGKADITATNQVKLTDGFRAVEGSDVHAYIDPSASYTEVEYNPTAGGTVGTVSASSSANYIRTTMLRAPETSVVNIGTKERIETIEYFDGLGRSVQNITVQGSPLKKDIVMAKKYDAFGRDSINFLPYVTNSSTGAYVSDPETGSINFYNNSIPGHESGNSPWNETFYESSPLNRVDELQGPDAWQTNPSYVEYLTNTGSVDNWSVSGSPAFYTQDNFSAGELYITQYTDEDGNQTREYKDKLGRVVCKASYDGSNWLETHYVYDNLGLLRCVVPPKASGPGDTELCYYYEYDERHRMIQKDMPGAETVYMVYDKRDRLVMVQDGNLRAEVGGIWIATIYDNVNRPVITAKVVAGTNRLTVQGNFDDFEGEATHSSSGTMLGYTTTSALPGVYNLDENNIQTVTYYDKYEFLQASDFVNEDYSFGSYSLTGYTVPQSSQTKGLVTGTLTRVLQNANDAITEPLLVNAIFYDDFGRPIRIVSDNHLGETDVVYNNYNFTGQITETTMIHNHGQSNQVKLATTYAYDHQGRLLTEKLKINDETQITSSAYQYNELGEQIIKYLHGSSSGDDFNQKIDYKYNIKGWLRTMNTVNNLGTDLFALDLRYNNPGSGDALTASALYNGDISELRWDTGTPKGYGFSYDDLSRLTAADYADGSSLTSNQNRYNASYGYDNNGNLSSLSRYLNATLVDNLTYTYESNSNRIESVNDATSNSNGYDDNNGTYAYDNNGNLNQDPSKGTNLDYNYLNLPEQVVFDGNEYLRYTYDAAGNKLVKVVDGVVSENNMRLDYSGNFIYEDGELKAIFTSAGRIVPIDIDGSVHYKFEYNLQDHLGNTRVVFSGHSNGQPEVMQVTDYYPFGMVMTQQNYFANGVLSNKYLYNKKELQDDELAGNSLDWYDYGARFYDPELGRWHSLDPLSEWDFARSPYAYVTNNPLRYIDPDGNFRTKFGAWLWKTFNGGGQTLQDQRSGEYFVSQRIEDSNGDDQVDVTVKRVFRGQKRYSNSSSRGYTQKGGIPFVTSGQSISPTKARAKYTDRPVNIDDLMPAIGGAGAGRFQRSPLDFAQGIGKIMDISSLNKDQNTSDKKILEEHGGSQKQKTDAQGVVFGTGKYSTWKKTKSLVGSSYEDATGDSVLYINHKGDSTLYIDITEQEGPGFEWRVKSPLK